MKKIVITALAALLATGAAAQAPIIDAGRTDGRRVTMFDEPTTVVRVNLVVRKESVRKGPYARFAQKYLGVIAPLSDRDHYTVHGAWLSAGGDMAPVDARPLKVVSHIVSDTSFVRITPDMADTRVRTQEEMASAAAEGIFTIRKRRFDLVSGEAGENVFGEGLRAAIERLDRLEQEYLSLFMGKTFFCEETVSVDVVPERDKSNYVVCRYSDQGGVLPASDLSGSPVTLELRSENTARKAGASRSGKPADIYRLPDMVRCRVVDGTREVASSVLPVYQWGVDVEVLHAR